LRDAPKEDNVPASIFVPDNAPVSLTDPQEDGGFAPAWNPKTNLISYLTVPHFDSQRHMWDSQRIMAYDPATKERAVLLTPPLVGPDTSFEYVQQISALAWSPHGQQLIFVLDKYVNCIDCSLTYPSQLYTFTPAPISE
jgi:Tol biopolymer transport system component